MNNRTGKEFATAVAECCAEVIRIKEEQEIDFDTPRLDGVKEQCAIKYNLRPEYIKKIMK